MGLEKYRAYRENHQDDGLEVLSLLGKSFSPDFFNRNTIQVWDVSSTAAISVEKWKGATLTDRTLHEVTIVNNSNSPKKITFNRTYLLPDEEDFSDQSITLGAQGSAHFYATAVLEAGNLFFIMRKGSQDNRKL